MQTSGGTDVAAERWLCWSYPESRWKGAKRAQAYPNWLMTNLELLQSGGIRLDN